MQVNFSNISFKKRLAANCAVLNNNAQSEPCSIYRILPDEDEDYFKKLQNDENWQNSDFLEFAISELPMLKHDKRYKMYSIENRNGNCLGFAEIQDGKDFIQIENLETAPKFAHNKKSKYKYIGETLVTFSTKLAQLLNKSILKVNPADEAIGFYSQKCGMEYDDDRVICELPKKQYNDLILQNEKHTGCSLEIVD
jgi:hypothetical protein